MGKKIKKAVKKFVVATLISLVVVSYCYGIGCLIHTQGIIWIIPTFSLTVGILCFLGELEE